MLVPIPLATLGALLDAAAFWQAVASTASAVALWAQQKAQPKRDVDHLQDLVERLRHPVRHALTHPVATVARWGRSWR